VHSGRKGEENGFDAQKIKEKGFEEIRSDLAMEEYAERIEKECQNLGIGAALLG
jgi:hypothetical protein